MSVTTSAAAAATSRAARAGVRPSPLPANGIDLGPGRRRVTQSDLNLYQALVGVPQRVELPVAPPPPRVEPVTDPLDPDDGDAPAPASTRWKWAARVGPVDPMLASIPASGGDNRGRPVSQPWTPATLCMSLADYCDELSVRIRRPQVSAWVKQVSKRARQGLVRAQSRLATPWGG